MIEIPFEMCINHVANLHPRRLLRGVISQERQELGDTRLPDVVISAAPGQLRVL